MKIKLSLLIALGSVSLVAMVNANDHSSAPKNQSEWQIGLNILFDKWKECLKSRPSVSSIESIKPSDFDHCLPWVDLYQKRLESPPRVKIGEELARKEREKARHRLNKCRDRHQPIPIPEVMREQQDPYKACLYELKEYDRVLSLYPYHDNE